MPVTHLHRRVALVFLGCLAALGYFHRPTPNPNENSRLALVLAVFHEHRLSIDTYRRAGPMVTTDESFHAGHYYSDKAPGSSILAAVGYAPVYAWERASGRAAPYETRKYAATLAADGVPVAAALCALFVLATAVAGPATAAGVAAAGLLATPLLPFGTTLFGHAVAGALLFLAFALLVHLARAPALPGRGALAGVGALLGMAVATEYTTAPAALLVAAYGLYRLARRGEPLRARTWVAPLLGAAPFALAVAAYHARCFGSPFSPGYENLASPFYRSLHDHGLVGIGVPRLDVAYYLTFHPSRGLFPNAPVLLLALPGLWAMLHRPGWRAEGLLCLGVFLSFLLANAGFGMWWGGYTYVARHLVPAVPFLLLPLAFLSRRWAWAAVPLFLASCAATLAATSGNPLTDDARLVEHLRALERAGGGLLPWRGSWSIAREVWPSLRARSGGAWPGFAPNAGRLLHLTGPASVLPLVVAVAAALGLAARRRRPGVDRVDAGRPIGAQARQGAT